MNLQLKRSRFWPLYNIPLIIRGEKNYSLWEKKILKSFPTETPSFWNLLLMHLATHGPYLVDKQDSFLKETQYSVFSY